MSEWQHGGSDAQQGVPKEGKHAPLADDVLAMIGKVSLQESEMKCKASDVLGRRQEDSIRSGHQVRRSRAGNHVLETRTRIRPLRKGSQRGPADIFLLSIRPKQLLRDSSR